MQILTPIITCEHAGKIVPPAYNHLFVNAADALDSHRGWDPGALEIATFLSEKLHAPFYKCEETRLLVEANRSLTSSSLFSEYSNSLSQEEREEVLRQFYYPHRSGVEKWITEMNQNVLHLSIHTFTPVFNGAVRNVDIGLLFDPARLRELEFCSKYQRALSEILPTCNILFNEPYLGTDDGFTTHLRTLFNDGRYLGIEIEVNQKFNGTPGKVLICQGLLEGLKAVAGQLGEIGVTL